MKNLAKKLQVYRLTLYAFLISNILNFFRTVLLFLCLQSFIFILVIYKIDFYIKLSFSTCLLRVEINGVWCVIKGKSVAVTEE